jgi:hypothetical protein
MAVATMFSEAVMMALMVKSDIDLLSSVARSATKTAHLPRNCDAPASTMQMLAAAKDRRLTGS